MIALNGYCRKEPIKMTSYLKMLDWNRTQNNHARCSDDTALFLSRMGGNNIKKYGKETVIRADNNYYWKPETFKTLEYQV